MPAVPLNTLGQLWLNAHYESIGRYTASSGRDMGSYCAAAFQLKSFLERSPDHALLARQLALLQMSAAHHSAPLAAMTLLGDTAIPRSTGQRSVGIVLQDAVPSQSYQRYTFPVNRPSEQMRFPVSAATRTSRVT